jgi:hypothetical protein
VVTRAGYAGIQRHAIVWTGDTSSHWEHLRDAVPMLLNLSLSGVPFCGGDVGGFLGNATPELFVRWLQFAAFTPFLRNHSNLGTRDQEPWAFGPEVEAIARETLRLRYQVLPLLYCLSQRAATEGEPLIRPLLYQYTNDPVLKRLSQLVMTDEAFHHKFGKIWADRTIPHLATSERDMIEDWAAQVFQGLLFNLGSPEQKKSIYAEFGIEWEWAQAAFREAFTNARVRERLKDPTSIFRVLIKTLLNAGIITDRTRGVYAAFVDMAERPFPPRPCTR